MHALLRGAIGRAAYVGLLRNLYDLYDALEGALQLHGEHPALKPMRLPGLARAAALAEDLARLHGPGWATDVRPVDSGRSYVQHLRHLERQRPALLAAHAYVRYLGDLSGGQLLKRIVAQTFRLDDGRGTAFYDFGPPPAAQAMALRFRTALGLAVLDPDTQDALIEEAKLAFALHISLFEGLAAAHGLPRAQAMPVR